MAEADDRLLVYFTRENFLQLRVHPPGYHEHCRPGKYRQHKV